MIGAGERPAPRGVTHTWIVPWGLGIGMVAAALAGQLSRSLFLDLVAWWPVWLLLGLLWMAGRDRKIGAVRVSGIVPLVATAVVVLFLVGHLQGWSSMPSSAAVLVGPATGDVEQAGLVAEVEGRVVVGSDATFLYELTPIRWGGQVGIPEAVEESVESATTITLLPPAQPGLQQFAGLNLRLSPDPVWALDLSGEVVADLGGLSISKAALTGNGRVVVGPVQFLSELVLEGEFTVEVPVGAPVRVVGQATVPTGWVSVEGGWHTPQTTDGWLITVAPGSSVVIVDAS